MAEPPLSHSRRPPSLLSPPGSSDEHAGDPPLLSPRPRSWSASRREMGYSSSSPDAVERMLQQLDAGGADQVALHEGLREGSESDGREGTTPREGGMATTTTPSAWPGSFDTLTGEETTSSDRSSRYTLARSHTPSSVPSSSNARSQSPLPPPAPPLASPSPHSAAAQEVLRTLAAMSSSRPAQIDGSSFYAESSFDEARSRLHVGNLSVLEERTEEPTSVEGSRTGERHDALSASVTGHPRQHQTSPPVSPRPPFSPRSTSPSRRSLTPDITPPRPPPAHRSTPRSQSSSPTRRERLLQDTASATPLRGRHEKQRSAADLIALFEGEGSGLKAEGKSTSLLLATAGSSPSAYKPHSLGLAERRSYLANLSSPRTANQALPVGTSFTPRTPTGRKSVFDVPHFTAGARPFSTSGPPTSPAALSRPALFPLRSFTAAEKGKGRALSETSSSPLEALTPAPLIEAPLPPLPTEPGPYGEKAREVVELEQPLRKNRLGRVAAALNGHNIGRKSASTTGGPPATSWAKAAAPLVRRGALIVRSLSRARGRSSSAPPAPAGDLAAALGAGGERPMRDAVSAGFSWMPEPLVPPPHDGHEHERALSTPWSVRSFDPALAADLERASSAGVLSRTGSMTARSSDPYAAYDLDVRDLADPPTSAPTYTGSLESHPPSFRTYDPAVADALERASSTSTRSSQPMQSLDSFDQSLAAELERTSSADAERCDGSATPTADADINKLLLYLQRQEQWRIGRDALQATQLEHIQQDVLTLREGLANGGPPLPPKDPPAPPFSLSSFNPSSDTSSGTARQGAGQTTGQDSVDAPVLALLNKIVEAEARVLTKQDDIEKLLAEDGRRRREEREAKAAEGKARNITMHRLDDLLRRVLWLLGDEVFHGEGGPPSEEESIYGPEVRPPVSHPPASIHDLASDEDSTAWEASSDGHLSRQTWRSSQHGVDHLENPPPSQNSTFSGSSSSPPDTSSSSWPTFSPTFSSLPPRSPPSGHSSEIDEADRRWDEIRRNRSLPHRPISASSGASTVRPSPSFTSELDEALANLARRAQELRDRERRLEDDEFRVHENADAQARWLADETARLAEEEERMRRAAEDELALAYDDFAQGAAREYEAASEASVELASRVMQHPANDGRDHHRRQPPPPKPIDLPSPVQQPTHRLASDFSRRGPSHTMPYPERIPYPEPGPLRPTFAGPYGSRSGFFSNLFPRRGRGFSYNSALSPFGNRYYPPTPPYGRGSSPWPRGPPGSWRDHSTSFSSDITSPTSSNELRRRTAQQLNDIAERVNDLDKELHDARAGSISSNKPPTHAQTASLDPITHTRDNAARHLDSAALGLADSAYQPKPGAAFFQGHPATQFSSLSRKSSNSDHRDPVNVTIQTPPATLPPPAPPVPGPRSPGLLGQLKDLAGPALGGIAGAALGDRFGHKEEEKDRKEDRKEERKAAAEERRAEERIAREAADRAKRSESSAQQPPVIVVEPPGAVGRSGGGTTASPFVVRNSASPARPALVRRSSVLEEEERRDVSQDELPALAAAAGAASRPPPAVVVPAAAPTPVAAPLPLANVPPVPQGPLTSAANVPTAVPSAGPAVPITVTATAPQPAAPPAVAAQPAALPTTASNVSTARPLASVSPAVPSLSSGGRKAATTSTTTVSKDDFGPTSNEGAFTTPATSVAEGSTSHPQGPRSPPPTTLLQNIPTVPAKPALSAADGAVQPSTAQVSTIHNVPLKSALKTPHNGSASAVPTSNMSNAPAADAAAPSTASLPPASSSAGADRNAAVVAHGTATPARSKSSLFQTGPPQPAVLSKPAPSPQSSTVIGQQDGGVLSAPFKLPPEATRTAHNAQPTVDAASGTVVAGPDSDGKPGTSAPSSSTTAPTAHAGRAPLKLSSKGKERMDDRYPALNVATPSLLRSNAQEAAVAAPFAASGKKPAVVGGPSKPFLITKPPLLADQTTAGRPPAAAAFSSDGRPLPSALSVNTAQAGAPTSPTESNKKLLSGRAMKVAFQDKPVFLEADGTLSDASPPADHGQPIADPPAVKPSAIIQPGVGVVPSNGDSRNAAAQSSGPRASSAPDRAIANAASMPAVPASPLKPAVLVESIRSSDGTPALVARPFPPAVVSTGAKDAPPVSSTSKLTPGQPAGSTSAPTEPSLPRTPIRPSVAQAQADGPGFAAHPLVPSSSSGAGLNNVPSTAPDSDLKIFFEALSNSRKEQAAALKALGDEMDKTKKEQAVLLAALAAQVEAGKKEQQTLVKTLGTDTDKAVKAAQKAATDEIKKSAKEQIAFNVNGHLDDFSKALAGEVKTLMKEVGDLREAKRALQHEIADLLLIRARHGAGDGMNLFPWQGHASKPIAAASAAVKPPAAPPKPAAAPKVAEEPTARPAGYSPWPWPGLPPMAAPAAPVALPKPPVIPPPAAAPSAAAHPPMWGWPSGLPTAPK